MKYKKCNSDEILIVGYKDTSIYVALQDGVIFIDKDYLMTHFRNYVSRKKSDIETYASYSTIECDSVYLSDEKRYVSKRFINVVGISDLVKRFQISRKDIAELKDVISHIDDQTASYMIFNHFTEMAKSSDIPITVRLKG